MVPTASCKYVITYAGPGVGREDREIWAEATAQSLRTQLFGDHPDVEPEDLITWTKTPYDHAGQTECGQRSPCEIVQIKEEVVESFCVFTITNRMIPPDRRHRGKVWEEEEPLRLPFSPRFVGNPKKQSELCRKEMPVQLAPKLRIHNSTHWRTP